MAKNANGPAPEIFHRKLTQTLEDRPDQHITVNDVPIMGQGETQEAAERDQDVKL